MQAILRAWHWHAQNLNERSHDREPGPMWRHGRAWLHRQTPSARFGWDDPDRRYTLRAEWVIAKRSSPALEFEKDDEEYQVHIGLGFAGFWLSYEPLRSRYLGRDRNIGLRMFDGGIWWTLWMSVNEWHSTEPRWRRGCFRPVDFLFGKRQYQRVNLEERAVLIPMPERPYRGVAVLHEDTWRRPRWPWGLTLRRVSIDMDVDQWIPIPGKGESAWDIDDDATGGITTAARSIEDGIGQLIASTLERRRRYGGRDWRPTPDSEAA